MGAARKRKNDLTETERRERRYIKEAGLVWTAGNITSGSNNNNSNSATCIAGKGQHGAAANAVNSNQDTKPRKSSITTTTTTIDNKNSMNDKVENKALAQDQEKASCTTSVCGDNSSPEMTFATRLLGSTNQRVRHEAVHKLQFYLVQRCRHSNSTKKTNNSSNDTPSTATGLSYLDLLKLWKALWYGLYMCDKQSVQLELSKQMSELLWYVCGTTVQDDIDEGERYMLEHGLLLLDDDSDEGGEEIEEGEEEEGGFGEPHLDNEDDNVGRNTAPSLIEDTATHTDGVNTNIVSDHDCDANNNDTELQLYQGSVELASLFIRAFFHTIQREWGNVDRHRVDKFYSMIRLMMTQVFKYISSRGWNIGIIHLFNDNVFYDILCPDDRNISGSNNNTMTTATTNGNGSCFVFNSSSNMNGIRLHLIDIVLDEMARGCALTATLITNSISTTMTQQRQQQQTARNRDKNNTNNVEGTEEDEDKVQEQAELNGDIVIGEFLICLDPYLALARGEGAGKNEVLHLRVAEKILHRFLWEFSAVRTRINDEVDDAISNGGNYNKIMEKDDKSSPLEFINVHAMASAIFDMASDPDNTLDRYRRTLYDVHKMYVKRMKHVGYEEEEVDSVEDAFIYNDDDEEEDDVELVNDSNICDDDGNKGDFAEDEDKALPSVRGTTDKLKKNGDYSMDGSEASSSPKLSVASMQSIRKRSDSRKTNNDGRKDSTKTVEDFNNQEDLKEGELDRLRSPIDSLSNGNTASMEKNSHSKDVMDGSAPTKKKKKRKNKRKNSDASDFSKSNDGGLDMAGNGVQGARRKIGDVGKSDKHLQNDKPEENKNVVVKSTIPEAVESKKGSSSDCKIGEVFENATELQTNAANKKDLAPKKRKKKKGKASNAAVGNDEVIISLKEQENAVDALGNTEHNFAETSKPHSETIAPTPEKRKRNSTESENDVLNGTTAQVEQATISSQEKKVQFGTLNRCIGYKASMKALRKVEPPRTASLSPDQGILRTSRWAQTATGSGKRGKKQGRAFHSTEWMKATDWF